MKQWIEKKQRIFDSGAELSLFGSDHPCGEFKITISSKTEKKKVANFETFIYQINQNEPSEAFAKHYLAEADKFFNLVEEFRTSELVEA